MTARWVTFDIQAACACGATLRARVTEDVDSEEALDSREWEATVVAWRRLHASPGHYGVHPRTAAGVRRRKPR